MIVIPRFRGNSLNGNSLFRTATAAENGTFSHTRTALCAEGR